jgi:outer membrane lipoprotein SlyB
LLPRRSSSTHLSERAGNGQQERKKRNWKRFGDEEAYILPIVGSIVGGTAGSMIGGAFGGAVGISVGGAGGKALTAELTKLWNEGGRGQ